jgi:hypothetical protein
MRLKYTNVFTSLMCAQEFWELDVALGRVVRKIRAPQSLLPHLKIIVDDLLGAYQGTYAYSYLCACLIMILFKLN